MNILEFGEPTAISRLHLTVTFRKHQNQPRKFTTSNEHSGLLGTDCNKQIAPIEDVWQTPKIQALDFEHLFNHDGSPQF